MTTAPPAFPSRRSLSIDRTILFVTLMVALGLVLIAQLWYLQVATGAQYLNVPTRTDCGSKPRSHSAG